MIKKIELRKARDFGQLFNDSIAFLRLNFKSFFSTVFFLAGPFVILTGLLMGYLQFISEKLSRANFIGGRFSSLNVFNGNSAFTLLLFILIFLLTTLVTNASISLYFKLYDEATPSELPVKRSRISSLLGEACWRLFYNLLLLTLILILCTLVLGAIFYFLYQVRVYEVIIGLMLFFCFILFFPVVIYLITIANFIVIRDKILITAALRKAITYLRGNFWWTWLLIFCSVISLGMLYLLFSMPYMLLTLMSSFTRRAASEEIPSSSYSYLLYVFFSALSMFGSMIVISPIFTCFCIFNFYNHEERHEGTSLMQRLDTFDEK